MAKPDLTPLNLGSVANGAALELFNKAIGEVVANIADTDTDPTAGREITLTFKFKPESDRRTIQVTTRAKTKLAGVLDHASRAYIAKDTGGGAYLVKQDPRQDLLFEPPAPAQDNLVQFGTQPS